MRVRRHSDKSSSTALQAYGLAFASLSLGGLAYSLLHVTVLIFGVAAVAAAIRAVVPDKKPAPRLEQRRRISRPLPGRQQPTLLSRSALDRHYLAVVAVELRRMRRELASSTEGARDSATASAPTGQSR
jgi:hypothetical protein